MAEGSARQSSVPAISPPALDRMQNHSQVEEMTDTTTNASCAIFVTALPDAALVVDQSLHVIAANAAASELLSTELEGKPLALFLRSPDVLNALAQCLTATSHHQVEYVVRSTIQRTLEVHLSSMGRGENGALALLLMRDRTREAQIERMRSDFVANASHELRTPLTTLSGFIETIQGAANKDEKARGEFLKLMKAQAERMSMLIDDLLSLSRIELDEHLIPHACVNLTDVVKQTVNLLHTVVKQTGCALEVNLPPQLQVRGDANQLAQVVHNLIENAIKYSGPDKLITVSGKVVASSVVLSVKDNGPGIAAHHLPRLTERFYRVSVQDSRTRGGTGLGLAICKHIINRHRGRLEITSDLGHGSVFSIHLPGWNNR
jgi:two-component system, OmpR family, phosphate regulon sensor histidine kinase PhoR